MEPLDLDARIRQLEARNRRLEHATLIMLALLILVSVLLVQQRWSATAQAGTALALILDENRKPEATINITPSGDLRLVSLRPDGSLPSGVALYDSAGRPRILMRSESSPISAAQPA